MFLVVAMAGCCNPDPLAASVFMGGKGGVGKKD